MDLLSAEYKKYAMDNFGCFQFFILIFNCIVADETDQQPQPVYIEMQPLRPRQQIQQMQTQQHPISKPPLIRQRKHICSESPELPPILHTLSSTLPTPEPIISVCAGPTEDAFETDFEIIEIADVNKES